MRLNPAVGRKKKIYSPSEGRNQKGSGGHSEVDLVPIMNLFVTIIPLLLQMVVMVTIAYVTLDLSSPQGAVSSSTKAVVEKKEKNEQRIKKLELVINIGEDEKEFFFFNKNGVIDSLVKSIPSDELSKLTASLKNYRKIMLEDLYGSKDMEEHENQPLSIIILPKDYVQFGTFVKTMDLCKKLHFSDIYLSNLE